MLQTVVATDIKEMALLAYLRRAFPAIPDYVFREALKKKDIRVNAVKVDASCKVRGGDEIKAYIDSKYTEKPSLKTLLKQDGLLAVEKPQGLPVDVDGNGIASDTVLSRVSGARLCHRLDAGTGGVLILSTTGDMHERLLRCFREDGIEKEYIAAVKGTPGKGSVKGYILKDAEASKVRVADRAVPGAKEAYTEYETTVSSMIGGHPVSLVRVRIHTGRTHQIRAHMASIGHPVIGDDKYGDRDLNRELHAKMPSLWCAAMTLKADYLPESLNGVRIASKPQFPLYNKISKQEKEKHG